MRIVTLVVAGALLAFTGEARAETVVPAATERWNVATLMDRAGVDRAWIERVAATLPASLRELPDTSDLQTRVSAMIPVQLKNMPGMSDHKDDQEMRAMVIAMGAMSGYMIAAMPLTLSGVAWAVAGGVATQYWYDNYR